MLRFVETFRQHNLSATFRANVRAMRATTVTPRRNVAEHPKRSLAFSEFSVVMTCWTLKVHLVVYDLKVTLVAQIVKRHNVRDDPVAANELNNKTDVKCDLGPSHCYPTVSFLGDGTHKRVAKSVILHHKGRFVLCRLGAVS